MHNGFLSIWFLDCINLIKYEGVDIFDSVLNISSGTWTGYWLIILWGISVLTVIKTMLNKK